MVDVAIYESVFNLLEGVVSEFDGAGVIRGPSGSTLTGIVPSNLYRGNDGKDIIIGANGDSLYSRLLDAMEIGKEDELRFHNSNKKRVKNQEKIDEAIGSWVALRSTNETLKILKSFRVPSGLIYSVDDMMNDPHYIDRNMFEEVDIPELKSTVKVPAISPKLSRTPGKTVHSGRSFPGVDTFDVLHEWLELSTTEIEEMIAKGAVHFKNPS